MFLWWIILVSHIQPLRCQASPPISEFKSVVCWRDFERMPENQLWISWLVNLPPPLVSLNKALFNTYFWRGVRLGESTLTSHKKLGLKIQFDFSRLLGAFWLPNRLRDGRPKLIRSSGQAKSLEIPYWKLWNTLIGITFVASLMYIYMYIYIYNHVLYIYMITWYYMYAKQWMHMDSIFAQIIHLNYSVRVI